MKAKLYKIECTDLEDVECYSNQGNPYLIAITLHIGVKNKSGYDLFNTQVMNLSWVKQNLSDDVKLITQSFIMDDFNFTSFKIFIEDFLSKLSGNTWEELAMKINEFARWEFYNYQN